jgi:hypothetical protein
MKISSTVYELLHVDTEMAKSTGAIFFSFLGQKDQKKKKD